MCANLTEITIREKERQCRKFKDPGYAQRFLSSHGQISNLFKVGRYKAAERYRQKLKGAFSLYEAAASTSRVS